MDNPTHLQYTSQHEWLDIDHETARVGITSYAASALGDVVFVDLPPVGTNLTAGEACGELESTKSVSDLFAPADGEVLVVNEQVIDHPGLLNTDPFGSGWLFQMRVTRSPELLTVHAYEALTQE